MRNLIIIGNGFDLAHGVKSSYGDFIKSTILNGKGKTDDRLITYNGDLISFRDILGAVNKSSHSRYFNCTNELFENMLIQFNDQNWCDMESFYYEKLLKSSTNLRALNSVQILNQNFKEIADELEKYLNEELKDVKKSEAYDTMFKLFNRRNSVILNFNYTQIPEKIYEVEKLGIKVINIHGELFNEDNPIIFGYAANQSESRELLSKKENEYLRFIKKHRYNLSNQEPKLVEFLSNANAFDLSILGHSFGESDKLILNDIVNSKKLRKIRFFYHENKEAFHQNQINLDRIMNNDENFKKVTNFPDLSRMAQKDDTPEQLKSFKDGMMQLIKEQDEHEKLSDYTIY